MEKFLLITVFQIVYPALWTLLLFVYFVAIRNIFQWAHRRRVKLIYHLDWMDILGLIVYAAIIKCVVWVMNFGVMGTGDVPLFDSTSYILGTAPLFMLMHLFIWINSDSVIRMRHDTTKNLPKKDNHD